MSTTITLTVAALGVGLMLCPAGLTLGEALERARAGEPLDGRIEAPVARDAAARVGPRLPVDELRALVAIARAGGAEVELARALARAARPDGEISAAALGAWLELPPEARAATDPIDLERVLLEGEGEPRALAARALVTSFPPDRVLWRLNEWAEEPESLPAATALLESWGLAPRRVDAWRALVEADLPNSVHVAAVRGLSALVGADAEVARAALAAVEEGQAGAGAIGLSSLALVPESFHAETREVLLVVLDRVVPREGALSAEGEDTALVAATVRVCAEHVLPELLPLLPQLTAPGGPTSVRVAATSALGRMSDRGRGSILRLIGLLEDREQEVREAAFLALRQQTGRRAIPADAGAWRAWLESANVPEPGETSPEARLEQLRKALRARRVLPES